MSNPRIIETLKRLIPHKSEKPYPFARDESDDFPRDTTMEDMYCASEPEERWRYAAPGDESCFE